MKCNKTMAEPIKSPTDVQKDSTVAFCAIAIKQGRRLRPKLFLKKGNQMAA